MADQPVSTTQASTTTVDTSGNATQSTSTSTTNPTPSTHPSTVVEIITSVANMLGVDVNLAIADAWVESGLNPTEPSGDTGGPGGLYQLNDVAGEGVGMTAAEINNPYTNSVTALSRFAAIQKAFPNADPGAIATLAQRPRAEINGVQVSTPTTPAEADATDYAKDVNAVYAQLVAGTPPSGLVSAGSQTSSASGGTGTQTTVGNTGAVLTDYVSNENGAWLIALDGLMNTRPSKDPLAQLFGVFDVSADLSSSEQFVEMALTRIAFTVGFTAVFLTGLWLVSPKAITGTLGAGVRRSILGKVSTGTAEQVAQIATQRASSIEAARSERGRAVEAALAARDRQKAAVQSAGAAQRHQQSLDLEARRAADRLKVTAAVGRRSKQRVAQENATANRVREQRLHTNARARAARSRSVNAAFSGARARGKRNAKAAGPFPGDNET